jgi:hypothetical protein
MAALVPIAFFAGFVDMVAVYASTHTHTHTHIQKSTLSYRMLSHFEVMIHINFNFEGLGIFLYIALPPEEATQEREAKQVSLLDLKEGRNEDILGGQKE